MIEFDASSLAATVEETAAQIINALDEPARRAIGFAGAEIFRDGAKRNAASHVKTGILYSNIIVKRLEEESDGGARQVYLVTVRGAPRSSSDAYYWRFVEFGHKFVPKNPNINPRTGKKFAWDAHHAAAALEYGTASAPAYPFMRPAYESQKAAAIDAMTKKLQEQLQRNAAR